MTTTTMPEPGVIPQPVLVPMTDDPLTNAYLIEQIESAFADIRVGVRFDSRGKVYAYLAPPIAHVHSIVIVPPSWYCPNPQAVTVVTLDPPPCPGQLKRVMAVLS